MHAAFGLCRLFSFVFLALILYVTRIYHPASDTTNHVQPNGAGITHTITRAELAAIAAAILLGYHYIATEPLLSRTDQKAKTLPRTSS